MVLRMGIPTTPPVTWKSPSTNILSHFLLLQMSYCPCLALYEVTVFYYSLSWSQVILFGTVRVKESCVRMSWMPERGGGDVP